MNVHDEFTRRVAADRLCRELARAIAENDTAALERLGMRGFGLYAGRLSELMTDSVRRELLGTDDFAGTDFGAIMGEVAKPAHYAHHLVNEGGSAIQQALDRRNGVRLRVVEPEFNDGRLKGIVGQIAESDSENAADNLATQLGTFVKDMGNEFMRQNAEQRDRAGFKVTVTRTGGAKCCPWCADRTGKWELANAPDGVFGCHDNCKCMVDYTNSKGTVRGRAVTHKIDGRNVSKWEFADKIPYTPPRVLTREEAAEKGGFSQPRRLTGGANGGIINTREPLSSFLNSSEQLYENAKKIIPLPDYQDIVIHGDKTGFSYKDKDGNETLLNVGEFTKILKESGLYKGGKIRLISCEAAAPGAHTAQWFANDMGVEVLAPTDIVWVDRDGNMTIGPDEFTDSGAWITIEPETEV